MRPHAFAMAVIFASGTGPAISQESHYTRHEYEACAPAPSPEPGVIEVRRCAGRSGIDVLWMSEPDSSSVSFGTRALDESLDLAAAFEAGTTIEWRSGAARSVPIAAIVRYSAGAGVGNLNRSVLVVYRVAPSGPSCIMAVVSGADANEKARRLVDASAAGFVCGKSARLAG